MKFKFQFFLLVLSALVIFGSFSFKLAEGVSLSDALYFCVVTITTVGYGDISPATGAGKLIAVFLIIAGGIVFVGLVSGITENIMNRREKEIRKQKLNVAVGVFFTELGNILIREFTRIDSDHHNICAGLVIGHTWTKRDFRSSRRNLRQYTFKLKAKPEDLGKLKLILERQNGLLLQLLINYNLVEHDMFTDLIQTISHKESPPKGRGIEITPVRG